MQVTNSNVGFETTLRQTDKHTQKPRAAGGQRSAARANKRTNERMGEAASASARANE